MTDCYVVKRRRTIDGTEVTGGLTHPLSKLAALEHLADLNAEYQDPGTYYIEKVGGEAMSSDQSVTRQEDVVFLINSNTVNAIARHLYETGPFEWEHDSEPLKALLCQRVERALRTVAASEGEDH